MRKFYEYVEGNAIESSKDNSDITIVGNGKDYPILSGYELTEKEKKDFDYIDDIDSEYGFFRYKKQVYFLGNFMRLEKNSMFYTLGFDGIENDTYFSGTLVKIDNSGESVKVYRFY